MFGIGNERRIEEKMAEWLGHPMEFAVRPEIVRLKRTYTDRFKIGTTEITEFVAKQQDEPVRGAGDLSAEVLFTAADPKFNLPSIYFLLGEQVIESVR